MKLEHTSYGTDVAGLFGINCRHQCYLYQEGVSRKKEYNIDSAENKRIYDLTQKQRKIERTIREKKRDELAVKEAGEDATKESAKVREWQGKMRDFIKESGLTRQYGREQI